MALIDSLTPDFLIQRYLLDLDQYNPNQELTGVPTGANGEPFPDITYQQQARTSIKRFEREFDLVIRDLITVTNERHDDLDNQTARFVPFCLQKRPVRTLTAVKLQVGNFPATETPLDWWEIVNGDLGVVRMMPAAAAWAVNSQGALLVMLTQLLNQPGLWSFSYTAGFDGTSWDDPEPDYPLDDDILDLVGNWATLGISDLAGDLLGGSGVASFSRSQDSLSTSLNTTSSPENHGYSAKQKQQRLRIDELSKAIRRHWSMPGIGAM